MKVGLDWDVLNDAERSSQAMFNDVVEMVDG